MALISKRHLTELQGQRQELVDAKAKLAEAEATWDRDRRQLGRQIADDATTGANRRPGTNLQNSCPPGVDSYPAS